MEEFKQGKLKFISCDESERENRERLYNIALAPYRELLEAKSSNHLLDSFERKSQMFKFLGLKIVDGAVVEGPDTKFYFEVLQSVWHDKEFFPFSGPEDVSPTGFVFRMSTSSPGAFSLSYFIEGALLHQRFQSIPFGKKYKLCPMNSEGIVNPKIVYKNFSEVFVSFQMDHFNKTKVMTDRDIYLK